MFDVLIVGSGAAAAAAALGLRGLRVAVLDVGYEPDYEGLPPGRLYDIRRTSSDLFASLIGRNFEAFETLHGQRVSPKLKTPGMACVTKNWRSFYALESSNFDPALSLAKGGFANAWGAGCFRFSHEELRSFPFHPTELDPHYDALTAELGISGCKDDLSEFWGTTDGLLPPLELSPWALQFLSRYTKQRPAFRKAGIFVGRPRVAVLTRNLGERRAYGYQTRDFFEPHQPSIYTPVFTIDRLIREGCITYLPGHFVERIEERRGHLEVRTTCLKTNDSSIFSAKKCILAAGAIGSARIALNSFAQARERIPLRENPLSFMVLFDPRRLGKGQESMGFGGAQISIVYRSPAAEPVQASVYDLSAVLRNDILFDLPFSVKSLPELARLLVPSFLVVQVFYPDDSPLGQGSICWPGDGSMRIDFRENLTRGKLEWLLARKLLKLGYFTAPPMWRYPVSGLCYHYAGTLPMHRQAEGFQCHPDGRLAVSRHTYVADAANFPTLPSKNLTFTAMANAMRIATLLKVSSF
ncbi:MAG: hypothetical protein KIS61_17015 [Candidatus Eremiobacteraeota bacterium]|nr:hypothetical protein [Candidatus Eremiobacteraeota bacterium]